MLAAVFNPLDATLSLIQFELDLHSLGGSETERKGEWKKDKRSAMHFIVKSSRLMVCSI